MGIIKLDAYVLLISGQDRYTFLDGLSTNKVETSCSTVLTTTKAKIIDVVDVIEVGDNLAVVGYEPYKDKVLDHLQLRVLQQNVTIRDITTLNNVYLSTENYPSQSGITVTRSYLGWILVTSVKNSLKESMTFEQFTEYRTKNIIPYQQHEITSDVHPFNCGLEHLVHEAKGCYIGQEILTRMRSRGKMGKQLVQVQIDAEDATSVGNEYALAIRRVPP
ncbi:MAG TPA: hypothetical protein HA320_02705 [Candidatus Poseidoniaceae archaeon]|nr:MAG TPA: hypothetical protein D7H78_02750 [Candidatus Poseidoniales archaeon]HII30947.1 hypothetical protein [Candidatus Poseidoniaceae archaeon]|tara:strand:- start:3733 stop:4389 length:657 start_codon:yes stop_codon:yes gene_type:complete